MGAWKAPRLDTAEYFFLTPCREYLPSDSRRATAASLLPGSRFASGERLGSIRSYKLCVILPPGRNCFVECWIDLVKQFGFRLEV